MDHSLTWGDMKEATSCWRFPVCCLAQKWWVLTVVDMFRLFLTILTPSFWGESLGTMLRFQYSCKQLAAGPWLGERKRSVNGRVLDSFPGSPHMQTWHGTLGQAWEWGSTGLVHVLFLSVTASLKSPVQWTKRLQFHSHYFVSWKFNVCVYVLLFIFHSTLPSLRWRD